MPQRTIFVPDAVDRRTKDAFQQILFRTAISFSVTQDTVPVLRWSSLTLHAVTGRSIGCRWKEPSSSPFRFRAMKSRVVFEVPLQRPFACLASPRGNATGETGRTGFPSCPTLPSLSVHFLFLLSHGKVVIDPAFLTW